jgi:hypothetical protein
MAPAEIPDSDEEDELGLASSPPPAALGARNDELHSPATPGHKEKAHATRSGSTDPAFFQSVYDEQAQAVRQKSRAAATKSHRLQVKEGNDPYDIPSSQDEEAAGSFQYKRQSEKEDTKQKKKKKKLKTKRERVATGSPPRQATQHDELPKQKRRRTNNSWAVSLDDVDEVNLVAIPTTLGIDVEAEKEALDASSMPPPPTLPVHELPSTLDPLQEAGESTTHMVDTSGWMPSQDQGPSGPGKDGPLIRSSGSATNINTQRSQPPLVYHDTSRAATQVNPEPDAGDPVWIGSSPDMLTESVTPKRSSRARKPPPPPKEEEGAAETILEEREQPDELNTGVTDAPDVASASYTSDEEPAALEEPVRGGKEKKKKQRGRPRKNAPATATAPAPAEPQADPLESAVAEESKAGISNEGGASAKKQIQKQKKRGRPKKTPIKAESNAPEGAADSLDTPDAVEQTEKKDTVKDGLKLEQAGVSTKDEVDAKVGTEEVSNNQEEPLPETPKDLSKSAAASSRAAELTKSASAAKSAMPSVTPGGKPLYRVGLSKRSRIAPLLKIVRKD